MAVSSVSDTNCGNTILYPDRIDIIRSGYCILQTSGNIFRSLFDFLAHATSGDASLARQPCPRNKQTEYNMSSIKISIINESTVVSDHEVIAATADLQTQVSRDFAAAWGVDANLTVVPSGSQSASGTWWW